MEAELDKIWEAKLDGRYDCRVDRIDGSTGRLTMTCNGATMLSRVVPLSYGSAFGPDVADVSNWEGWCIEAVNQVGK